MDSRVVLMKTSSFLAAATLAVVIPGIVGCDKAKQAMTKLIKPTTSASPGSEESASPETPAVKASYSRDQVSDISPTSYPSFVARTNALVLVDFHADWCGPCRTLGPVLAQAAEENPGVVYIGKMDVDQAGDFPGKLGVQGIPDVRIFKNGKEVDRFVGFPGKEAVLEKIAKHAKGIQPASTPVTPSVAAGRAQPGAEAKPFSKGWLPPGMSRAGEAKVPPKAE